VMPQGSVVHEQHHTGVCELLLVCYCLATTGCRQQELLLKQCTQDAGSCQGCHSSLVTQLPADATAAMAAATFLIYKYV